MAIQPRGSAQQIKTISTTGVAAAMDDQFFRRNESLSLRIQHRIEMV
jgi:hypothetical protein